MKKFLVILIGLLLIVGGVVCLFRPVSTFLTTGYIVGVFILCDAIANIIAWFDAKKYINISGWYLFDAIMSLIFGIIVVVNGRMQFAVDMAIVYMVCAWVIIASVFRISLAIRIKKVNDKLPNMFKNSRWISLLVVGILMIIFAVICMVQPGIMSALLGTFISMTIIFNGVGLVTLGSYIPSKA